MLAPPPVKLINVMLFSFVEYEKPLVYDRGGKTYSVCGSVKDKAPDSLT